jgi:DNA-binding XRE family transcriptional regulator
MANSAHYQLPNAAMIRAARALLAVDQSKLALLVGVTVKTISMIENSASGGKVDERRRKVVERIRRRLEDEFNIEFLFSAGRTGFGVRMRKAD